MNYGEVPLVYYMIYGEVMHAHKERAPWTSPH